VIGFVYHGDPLVFEKVRFRMLPPPFPEQIRRRVQAVSSPEAPNLVTGDLDPGETLAAKETL
jgi:hypothetical protein